MKLMMRTGFAVLLVSMMLALSACATERLERPNASRPTGNLEYTLSAGDKIHVIVFGEETLTGDYVITSGGNLTFPLVGNLPASGKTVEQLQAALSASLADGFVNNPRVSMQVVSFRPFYILGEVNRPGEYPVATGLTLEQAVASAGGYTYRANTRRAYVKRANETTERMFELRGGDTIVVRAGDTIRIGERHF